MSVVRPRPECSFILATGVRCHMTALSGNRFCYYHSRAAQRRHIVRHMLEARRHHLFDQDGRQPIARDFDDFTSRLISTLDLPEIEDATSLSVALNAIFRALQTQQIPQSLGSLLLRACRIQASLLKDLKSESIRAAIHKEQLAPADPDPLRDPYDPSIPLDQLVAAPKKDAAPVKGDGVSHPVPAASQSPSPVGATHDDHKPSKTEPGKHRAAPDGARPQTPTPPTASAVG